MGTEIYFDGATAAPNPGNSGIGIWVPSLNKGWAKNIGVATNNEAEWEGLIFALNLTIEELLDDAEIFGDSQLIVYCSTKIWETHKPHLIKLKHRSDRAFKLYEQCFGQTPKVTWKRREYNTHADTLSKIGLNLPYAQIESFNWCDVANDFIVPNNLLKSTNKLKSSAQPPSCVKRKILPSTVKPSAVEVDRRVYDEKRNRIDVLNVHKQNWNPGLGKWLDKDTLNEVDYKKEIAIRINQIKRAGKLPTKPLSEFTCDQLIKLNKLESQYCDLRSAGKSHYEIIKILSKLT